MKRTITFLQECYRQRDWAAGLLCLAIAVTYLAAVSILFSKPMAAASLKRFHLASDSFGLWATHQCVPSMYNFENKIVFSNLAADLDNVDEQDPTLIKSTLNHFPARIITFGDLRSLQFGKHDQATFRMVSTFQGQRLTSTWKIDKDNQCLKVTRVDELLQETSGHDE